MKTRTAKIQLLPTAMAESLRRRMRMALGAVLAAFGAAWLLSLASYSPLDPSFNTAASNEQIYNWMGRYGANLSDLLIQVLGLASALPGIAMVVWGMRWAKLMPRGISIIRFVLLLCSVLLCSFAASSFSVSGGVLGKVLMAGWQAKASTLPWEYTHIAIKWAGALLAGILFVTSVGITPPGWQRLADIYMSARQRVSSAFNVMASIALFPLALWRRAGDLIPERRSADGVPKPAKIKKPKPVKVSKKTEPAPKKQVMKPSSNQPAAGPLFDSEGFYLPPLDILSSIDPGQKARQLSASELDEQARLLESVLSDFGVQGEIVKVNPGPVVTLYELEPAPGTKSSRVIALADDIARSMSAISVRVAVVPGRNAIGIELPNDTREMVALREMLESSDFRKSKAKLALALGKDIAGNPVIADLAKMPHLLVAGTTGSGKSVAVNTMIASLLYRHSPEECRLIMVDPKMLELSIYDGIPHLLSPVVTDPKKAVVALKWTVREMEDRYRAMSNVGVRNIEGYNTRLKAARDKGEVLTRRIQTGFDPDTGKPLFEEQQMDMRELPYIVVIIDEMADLMLVAGKEIEAAVQRLAQMARAAGIHLITATQRPSVDVITGTIKANFPTRISFAVTSKIDSRTILGEQGAEQLLGMGDMLYMASGGRVKRVHGPFVSDGEVERIVKHLRTQGEPDYVEAVTDEEESGGFLDEILGGSDGGDSELDALYDQAVALVCRERKASTSFVQRHLKIGYNRAARIIEDMESQGVISKANHVGKRDVLARNIDEEE